MKTTLGIDFGINGGLAFITEDDDVVVMDMPTHQISVGGKKKTRLDMYEIARIIDCHDIDIAIGESISSSPQMGVSSAFQFGEGFGLLKGIIAANFIPLTLVRPQEWKKAYGLIGQDKSASRAKASSIFPEYACEWSLKKHDGRAEAVLIGLWGKHNAIKRSSV